jgi:hypothetical protein
VRRSRFRGRRGGFPVFDDWRRILIDRQGRDLRHSRLTDFPEFDPFRETRFHGRDVHCVSLLIRGERSGPSRGGGQLLSHFISHELGGHPRDAKNLWPEMWGTPGTPLTSRGPFPPSLVGAEAKDRAENALNTAVCNGTMTLQEAQHIIATDWFKYYRDHMLK